jgi:hypothetical protein
MRFASQPPGIKLTNQNSKPSLGLSWGGDLLISLAIIAAADKGYQIENPWVGLLIPLGIFAAIGIFVLAVIRNQPKDKSQNARSESDWRIHYIPYEQSRKAGTVSVGGWVMTLAGLALFLISFAMLFSGLWPAMIVMAPAGFLLVMFGTLVSNRTKRKDWVRLKAVCLDREHKRVWGLGSVGAGRISSGYTWTFRLLCKFELDGREYVVTPWFWHTFWSERDVRRFYAKAIGEDGTCSLYVNPRNPLETELSVGGMLDFLLH